jgi:hypothetical protein
MPSKSKTAKAVPVPAEADRQMQLRMPVKIYERLRRAAFREHRTMASLIRIMVAQSLKERRPIV